MRGFCEADEGTRTLDLLHGKERARDDTSRQAVTFGFVRALRGGRTVTTRHQATAEPDSKPDYPVVSLPAEASSTNVQVQEITRTCLRGIGPPCGAYATNVVVVGYEYEDAREPEIQHRLELRAARGGITASFSHGLRPGLKIRNRFASYRQLS